MINSSNQHHITDTNEESKNAYTRIANLFAIVASGVMMAGIARPEVKASSSLAPIGWASVAGEGVTTTTGGGNAATQRVTTIEELRTLAGDGTPRVIEISGTIDAGSSAVETACNKTLAGADKSATIKGGINVKGQQNIIVRI